MRAGQGVAMALWWVGNALFLVVIIPVVVLLLNRLMRPAVEIKRYADDVLEHGVLLIASLDAVEKLVETRDLVRQVGSGVARYGRALDKIL